MDFEKFDRLVQKVDILLARLSDLGRERDELKVGLQQKTEEISFLKEKVSEFEKEREQVLSRVDDLLGRIDQVDSE